MSWIQSEKALLIVLFVFLLLGWMYYNKEHLGDRPARMEKAVQLLLKAIETDPNSGAAWYLIGRCGFLPLVNILVLDI